MAELQGESVQISPRGTRGIADRLESADARQIIEWAVETYGERLCLTTSFANTVLAHLATQVHPGLDVIFLDTGFHFAETLETMRSAFARYQLNLTVVRPEPRAVDLWAEGATSCCEARKVGPLNKAMEAAGFDAWLSGLRRADSPGRANTPIVQTDRHGRIKINPIANWSDQHVDEYIATHELIVNPLSNQGYGSIGCWPCTEASTGRDGRWATIEKTECGLHLPAPATEAVRATVAEEVLA